MESTCAGRKGGVASDIALVLRTEHRQLKVLADRCGRDGRGFQDPVADLRRELIAHLSAVRGEVYPAVPDVVPQAGDGSTNAAPTTAEDVADPDADVAAMALRVVAFEEAHVVPALEQGLSLAERRRIGKVFRIRRTGAARAAGTGQRRQRSQSELYEAARRAGVEQRSRMTVAQLQAAVEAVERSRTG